MTHGGARGMHRKTEEDPAPNLSVAESDFSKPAEGQKKTTTGCLIENVFR
jgi:hypothetical protein